MSQALKIAVAPASTKTGVATIRSLLQQAAEQQIPISIRGFYRNVAKAPNEFTSLPNFEAVKGDLTERHSLDLSGIDSVVTATPPDFSGTDIVEGAQKLSLNVSEAVEAAGSVRKLVLLTSQGAHLDYGVGEIKTNNAAESVFRHTRVPLKTFVRCSFFMENWTMFTDSLKDSKPHFYSTITPLDYGIPMVAVADIGVALAREALAFASSGSKSQPHIYELHGPKNYTPLDVQAALTEALGVEVEVRGVEPKDLDAFYGQIFPPHLSASWVEMVKSVLPGGVAVENPPAEMESGVVRGCVTLDEAVAKSLEGFASG